MQVYDLIKELASYDATDEVVFVYDGDEDCTCPNCKEDITVSVDKTFDVDDIKQDRVYRHQVNIKLS